MIVEAEVRKVTILKVIYLFKEFPSLITLRYLVLVFLGDD